MHRIACVSQKGGVGKSTLARDFAVQFSANGWKVQIADMDVRQTTSAEWAARRKELGYKPDVMVFGCKNADTALSLAGCDLVIFDGKPYSDQETAKIAAASNMVVIPTAPTRDDLLPQVMMAHELGQNRVGRERIIFVINSVVSDLDSIEVTGARQYIESAGYRCAQNVIPRRSAYSQAHNIGKSMSEVSHPTLRIAPIGIVTEINALMKETMAA